MDKLELMLEADRRGILPPEQKAYLDEAVKRGILKVAPNDARAQAPTVADIPGAMPSAPPVVGPEPGLMDHITAPVVALRALIQNTMASGIGTAQGAVENLGNGPAAIKRAGEIADKLSYQPTNPVAQKALSDIADFTKTEPVRQLQALGPGGGLVGEIANLGVTAPAAAQAARIATEAPAVKGLTSGAKATVSDLLRPAEKPAMAGGGAAVTADELLRRQRAAELPISIDLSKGEATRNFDALRLEKEGMKDSGKGAEALRGHAADNVEKIIKNFESWIDETGAQAPDLISTGKAVDRPLIRRMESAKSEIRNAYNKAEAAGDMAPKVKTDELVNWVNENQSSAKLAPIIKVAEDEMIRLGGAARDAEDKLVPKEMAINDVEKMRKRIVRDAKTDETNQTYGSRANSVIDNITEGQGGDLYKQARGMFKDYAAEFKNQGAVRRLVSTKPGSTDRTVALEDVWNHTVLSGSNADTQNILRSLEKSGPEGAQAINEIRGQTMNYIMGKTLENASRDIRGNPIPSFSKIDRAVKTLDADGKLELIFGKKQAEQIRDIRDVIGDIQTAPPGAVNSSTTAAVLKDAITALATGRVPTATAKGIAGIRSAIAEGKKNKQYLEQLKQPE